MNTSTPPVEITAPRPIGHAHVVFLVNFVAPNLVAVCQQIARRVGRLTILSSVAMESNRSWASDWADLDVIVQRSWTLTRHPRHPGGYREVNYIHIPTDTLSQLRRLRPDAVVSLEMGARSALSAVYRRIAGDCAHVVAVYASQRSEAGRGPIRQTLRRQLLRRADWVTFNGPSCQELLLSLGADPSRMSPWNYAADPRKPYRGPLVARGQSNQLNILTVGQLTDRKGMLPATAALARWAAHHSSIAIQWNVVGSGPLESVLRDQNLPENLCIRFHGHCDPEAIGQHYRDNDLLLFPTLADEWGLVVDEALLSGLPVIGSCHSQAVTTLITDDNNGMIYDPEQSDALGKTLDRWKQKSPDALNRMRNAARQSVHSRTPETSAMQLVAAIEMAMTSRGSNRHVPQHLSDPTAPDHRRDSPAVPHQWASQ